MAVQHIGPYEVRGELGSGAMARVWRGWDPTLRREVAIKEPLFDEHLSPGLREEMGRRFADEACTAARLQHPGIVTIYAADVWDGRPAIVMELVEGETLASVLKRGRVEPHDALMVLDQLLDAIGYAHSQGVVHRDIKPDNIFITPSGTVKLGDFGIAHSDDPAASNGTMIGTILGTPGYMSPEQAAGQPADERSDLFSVGVVGYEMLTGNNPFGLTAGADATTLIYRTVHEDTPTMPDFAVEGLPTDVRPAIMSALSKHPTGRPQTASEFQALLHGRSPIQGFIPSAQVTQEAPLGAYQPGISNAGSAQGAYTSDVHPYATYPMRQGGMSSPDMPSAEPRSTAGPYQPGPAQMPSGTGSKSMPPWLPYALVGGMAALLLSFALGSALGGRGGGFVTQDTAMETPEPTPYGESPDGPTDGDIPSGEEQLGSAGVEIKGNLSEYSWDELADIALAIENCYTSADAYDVAEEYNLVDASGDFYSASKTVDMNDGKTLRVKLVGIWHDEADTASGKAGLTFLADDAQYRHKMSNETTMPGGWEASKLRAWLSSDLYQQFPVELSSCFLPVYKRTNNTGVTTSLNSVTETMELLWVPSIVELTGPLNWEYYSHPENRAAYNDIFNAEGKQYAAFEQAGVIDDGGNAVLNHGEPWWTRSTAPASSRSRYVGSDGDPAQYGDANQNLAVMVGFCL